MSKKKTPSYVSVPHTVLPGIFTEIPCNRKARLIDISKKNSKTKEAQNRQKPKRKTK